MRYLIPIAITFTVAVDAHAAQCGRTHFPPETTGMRTFNYNQDVADKLTEVRGSKAEVDGGEKYADATILAFIHLESSGDYCANRPGSQFHGLLQMGDPAAADVGLASSDELQGEDGNPFLEDDIVAFLQLMERYAGRHDYIPMRMAILWKGGAGTASLAGRYIEQGMAIDSAGIKAAQEKGVPRMREYLADFRRSLLAWQGYIQDKDLAAGNYDFDEGTC